MYRISSYCKFFLLNLVLRCSRTENIQNNIKKVIKVDEIFIASSLYNLNDVTLCPHGNVIAQLEKAYCIF